MNSRASLRLAVLILGLLLFPPLNATQPESFRIGRRDVPVGFEGEARFLELLKNPNPTVRAFRADDAPNWDLASLGTYISEDGVEFTDVNGSRRRHASKQQVLNSLREREGDAFLVFSHLSSIYSIPYKQYSELHFSSPTPDKSLVDMADWYRLTFKRTAGGPRLLEVDYLMLEGE